MRNLNLPPGEAAAGTNGDDWPMREAKPLPSVCVVGSGARFVSGVSYYTHRLASAFAERGQVSVILMRQLIPTVFYPGRNRVGADVFDQQYPESVDVYDGVDWYVLPSIIGAIRALRRSKAEFAVFEWWTGAVAHNYLLLAIALRLFRAKLVIEFHEVQDTGEARIPFVSIYTRFVRNLVCRLAHGFVVHSEQDRRTFAEQRVVRGVPMRVVHHGPFDQYVGEAEPLRDAPPSVTNVLFFGTIRPYKGLEVLVRAFNSLRREEVEGLWLTVVGETWEGWNLPAELIAASPHRDRITFVNEYVHDSQVAGYFAGADAVVLPYLRSSASGPLHIAMSAGLPLVVTSVPALAEVVREYDGCSIVEPGDPDEIAAVLRSWSRMEAAGRRQRFADPHSWTASVDVFSRMFEEIQRSGKVAR